ncbi:MAG: recombinase family protein [Frisingicoccus sp.]|uniref:recombinase family protein n=1 Tax=Frisingicoccus sp. TaxID=1918627 RepID=UPI0039997219
MSVARKTLIFQCFQKYRYLTSAFERPGFERLMSDIRAGQINCIIVKDFSRFGRNYIETGDYLEKIFPFLKVRFISVCDHYDSFAKDADSQELSMNIKNLVNDAYAKDISAKCCASKRACQKNGSYVGGMAPYGYHSVNENGIRKLVIDPETAEIVRRIFEQYTDGMPINRIIDGLFENGVHRISDYNRYHHVYCQDGEVLHQWGNSSIRAVLTRNNYYGDLVQHKYESRFSRGEKWCDLLDEREWIITSEAHEPIISRDMFDKAQIRLKAAKEARSYVGWDENDRAFYNIFYCGDCGRKMATCRTRGHVEYFCQASRYKDGRRCQTKNISEDKLQKIVRSELSRQLQLLKIKKKDITAISRSVLEDQLAIIRKELDKMETDYQKISDQSVQSFLMYKEGKISLQAYLDIKEERSDWETFFQERRNTLGQKIHMLQKQQKEEAKFLRSLLELEGTSRLNAELVEALIDRISLYGDGHLEIVFKFQGVMADDR